VIFENPVLFIPPGAKALNSSSMPVKALAFCVIAPVKPFDEDSSES